MARYLVVAHESVSNPKLVEKLKKIAKQDDTAVFVLLVPASPVRHLLLWKTDTATEQEAAEHRQAEGRRRTRGVYPGRNQPGGDENRRGVPRRRHRPGAS